MYLIEGVMRMKEEEIIEKYNEIKKEWETHLKSENVKLPKLHFKSKFTINALVLVYLYKNIGKPVSKKALTLFVKEMGHDVNDIQQARHLAQQSGWYILSGTRGDIGAIIYSLTNGEYLLKTIKEPYPSYSMLKRTSTLNRDSWDDIKKMYSNRCASCGSEEGMQNRYYPSSITKLQKGHMNPNKPLELGNIIPQCSKCNQPDRNYFIYDRFGRVISIADAKYIKKATETVQKDTLELLIEKYPLDAKKILEKKILWRQTPNTTEHPKVDS